MRRWDPPTYGLTLPWVVKLDHPVFQLRCFTQIWQHMRSESSPLEIVADFKVPLWSDPQHGHQSLASQ